MKKDLAIRIGIIGAGPAGLSAAEKLKTLGYTNITILEKTHQAGGKCFTTEYLDRPYELGAGIISANNHSILNLAKKFKVKILPVNFSSKVIFLDNQGDPINRKVPFTEKLSFLHQLFFKYKKLAKNYQKITEPGLANVDKSLCIPFSKWASNHKIPLVAKELAPFFTGFGYSYFDEVPAAYVLKYYSWPTLQSFIKKSIYYFPDGIQKLWTTIAQNHHIFYNSFIEKIDRNKSIKVQTEKQEIIFDKLILACPLDQALQYLDASEQEKNLFSKITYCDYRTYACSLENFPKQDGYLPGNFRSSRQGHPLFWYNWEQRHTNSDLYTFYILGDWKISDQEVLNNIKTVVNKLGGSVTGTHTITHWKYFPHVSCEDLENGYFDQLEALQGQKNTYYTGEFLNFSTVDLSAQYSEKLIERFF